MMDFGDLWMGLVTGSSLFMWIDQRYRERISKTRQRTRQLELAASALKDHFTAAEIFLDDPAAPDELKSIILRFSECCSKREFARTVRVDVG